MPVLEQLMRGKCLTKNSEVTQQFAITYQKKLREAGCLGETNEILIDRFEAAHMNGTLNLKKLSFAIGNRDID
jgi:hypothetical protein